MENKEYKIKTPEFYGPGMGGTFAQKAPCPLDTTKLKLERTANGVVVEFPSCEEGVPPCKECFLYDEDDLSGVVLALYAICDWMGGRAGRHAKVRVAVRLEHGDKYECKDKKCKICKP